MFSLKQPDKSGWKKSGPQRRSRLPPLPQASLNFSPQPLRRGEPTFQVKQKEFSHAFDSSRKITVPITSRNELRDLRLCAERHVGGARRSTITVRVPAPGRTPE